MIQKHPRWRLWKTKRKWKILHAISPLCWCMHIKHGQHDCYNNNIKGSISHKLKALILILVIKPAILKHLHGMHWTVSPLHQAIYTKNEENTLSCHLFTIWQWNKQYIPVSLWHERKTWQAYIKMYSQNSQLINIYLGKVCMNRFHVQWVHNKLWHIHLPL